MTDGAVGTARVPRLPLMIKLISGYLRLLALGLLGALVFPSCVYDTYDEDLDGNDQAVRLVLQINAIGPDTRADNAGVVEMINSLRIIMINEDGALEVNDKITSADVKKEAAGFSYTYFRFISPGKKRVYLVANEESVGEVRFSDTSDLPSLPTNSLSSLFSHFTAGADAVAAGQNMEKVLGRVYFNNDNTLSGTDGKIYLPYSSTYEITVEDIGGITHLENPLYLVPVATKLDLIFINRREKTAQVDDVLFCSLNRNNYLNARLDPSEQTRQLHEQNVWWIDWLQACSVASQSAQDNVEFNKLWGWIKKYELPLPGEQKIQKSLNPNGDLWVVDALEDKNNPYKLQVGPFYLPESIQPTTHTPDEYDNPEDAPQPGDQLYTLTFKVRNQGEDVSYTIAGIELFDVKALFRGTHVVVTAEFFENEVEIYAEIGPWVKRRFLGFLQEDV